MFGQAARRHHDLILALHEQRRNLRKLGQIAVEIEAFQQQQLSDKIDRILSAVETRGT